ncbi:MAG: secretin and TonB N-terminal domain-containing protein, partial [Proteobacteria bacterium]|nr:secretin and TonB N-terminal domain-containing protein [Pseudomonadota bacterium]
MKRAIQWIWLVFLVAIMTAVLPPVWGAPPTAPDSAVQTVGAGYLENVTFEKLPGKERVTLTVSKQSGVTVENPPGNAVLVRLENLFVPEGLRRPLSDAALANVVRVTPVQKTADGRSWVIATIDLKQKVPYSVRQEGMNVLIDFNVTSVAAAASATDKPSPAAPDLGALQTPSPAEKPAKAEAGEKVYGGPRIFLDVQDADIKAVFRLLSEQGNVSIVSGDDVKGTVTLHLKDVSWNQALDTILSIKGLGKKQTGNVITVMTMDKIRKDETILPPDYINRVVRIDYNDAKKISENIVSVLTIKDGKPLGSVKVDEHSNSLIIQSTREDMTKVLSLIERIDKPTEQILIKANIVETTKSTARDLGIKWGGLYNPTIGDYTGWMTPNVAFPATPLKGTAALLDLSFGTLGGNILDLQLSALQRDGKLNILSSPSIMTMDNKQAVTENGEKIPIRTLDKDGNPTTTYFPATLKLTITPHVIDGENLKMDINVKKDEVDMTRMVLNNPFIINKETTTNLVVKNGDTIVISGLTKQKNEESTTGLPWFKDIPVLG